MQSEKGEIVLVHGLWFGAWSLGPLAWRLERSGLPVRRFSYRTTRAGLDDHAVTDEHVAAAVFVRLEG